MHLTPLIRLQQEIGPLPGLMAKPEASKNTLEPED
jgi:hypothetical protein